MYSHSICRDTSIEQSCSYEQESKATVFQKLFSLKAHLYILEGYPQALSQNQCIFYVMTYSTKYGCLISQVKTD